MFVYHREKIGYYLGIFLTLIIVIVILKVWVLNKDKQLSNWPNFDNYLYINNKRIKVAIADTNLKRQRGFMYVKKIPQDSGILFIFDEESKNHCFWMKNTIVKLSIAFINKAKEIIQINDMTPLDTTSICPSEKILYALEVEQGYFQKNNIKEKDKVVFER